MNLKFWKKKPENDNPEKGGPAGESGAAQASLLSRIKAQIAALAGRFSSPLPFKADVADIDAGRPAGKDAPAEPEKPEGKEALSESEPVPDTGALARAQTWLMSLAGRLRGVPEGETPPAGRMALIIAGMMLLLLLLGAFGYAAWTIVLSSPDPEADVAELIADDAPLPIVMPESAPPVSDVPAAPEGEDAASAVSVAEPEEEAQEELPVSPVAEAESAAELPVSQPPLTEVEALRRKNAELQAELDALRKSQRSSAAVKLYPGGRGTPAGGVATVGSSDPAAAAATLKEAIDAMNNGRSYRQDPAR